MNKKQLLIYATLVLTILCAGARQAAAVAVISPGTPITNDGDVPAYLRDGSYLFGITVPTLGSDDFLLPVEISGAASLQSWQFTLTFDNTVVSVLDPSDGTSGIYGAEFTSGDPNTLSFILGGFPFNALGEVDSVAGSYPSLLTGPSRAPPIRGERRYNLGSFCQIGATTPTRGEASM